MRLRVEKSVVMLKYYTWTRRNQSFLAKTPHIFITEFFWLFDTLLKSEGVKWCTHNIKLIEHVL